MSLAGAAVLLGHPVLVWLKACHALSEFFVGCMAAPEALLDTAQHSALWAEASEVTKSPDAPQFCTSHLSHSRSAKHEDFT